MGRVLIVAGLTLLALGVVVSLGDRLPFRLGQLPGDLTWRGRNSTVSFPIMTCILLSILASGVMWLLNRGGK